MSSADRPVPTRIPRWELILAWSLRVVLLATAIGMLATERWTFAVFSLIALAIGMIPTLLARSSGFAWPVEIELVLLWIVSSHVGLGYLLHLYKRVEFFDKLLHFGDSALIGFIAFAAVYISNYVRDDRPHPYIDGVAIFLITLGLGALWEIAEFTSDQLTGSGTQGSPTLAPLADTMWDLIVDGLGGAVAALLGPVYMKHSRRAHGRVMQVTEQLRHRRGS